MTMRHQCDFCDEYKEYNELVTGVKIKGTNRRGNVATIYTVSSSYRKKNPLLDILIDDKQDICKTCVSNLTWEATFN